MTPKIHRADGRYTDQEWREVILPLAMATINNLRARGVRLPKTISDGGMVRLAFGLLPRDWGMTGARVQEGAK